MNIVAWGRNVDDVVFRECNFHNKQGQGISIIQHVTFKGCSFERCMMGTTKYERVRFIDCTFERCDFVNADFVDCAFVRCTFKHCTCDHLFMTKTQINSIEFMAGLTPPLYNYSAATSAEKIQLERSWLEVRQRVAAKMFSSLTETNDTSLCDKALLELKRAENSLYVDIWLYGTHDHKTAEKDWLRALTPRRLFVMGLPCGLRWLNLRLTAGGTSLRNLVWTLLVGTLLVPPLLAHFAIRFNGVPCTLNGPTVMEAVHQYVSMLPPSLSLLLAFGFGNFQAPSASGTATLVALALAGLSWYSLLIPVIIRRVYR